MGETNILMAMIYGHSDPLEELGPIEKATSLPFDDGARSVADPIGQFLEKAELNMLKGAAVGIQETSWDTPLTKALELSPEFIQRSNQRFEKACSVIQRVFGSDPEIAEEAIKVTRQMFTDARNEALSLAAA